MAEYGTAVHEASRKAMGAWYDRLAAAAKSGAPSAYIMIAGNCVEILRAFDIEPVFPEVNALQLAIRKQSLPLILKAEEMGYSSDNCAYVKADAGFTFGEGAPGNGKIPKPTFIACNFVGCNVYIKWFEHCAEFLGVPLRMLDVPFVRGERPSAEDTAYVVAQLKSLIGDCERVTGKRFDIDRLREVCALSAKAEEGWQRCKDLCKAKPSPMDAYFDAINLMGPINVLRGTQDAVDFFDVAVREYEALAAAKRGPIPEEKHRIVVEGPPPYPFYRQFRDLFAGWGAVAVQSTYSTVGGIWEFGFRHDPKKPLESIAEQMLMENLCNRSLLDRYKQIKRYLDEWKADALVIHSVKSCRLFSAGQGDMRDYFANELGVPTLLVESDLEDPRYYAQAMMKNRIDAFFESLEHRKLTRRA